MSSTAWLPGRPVRALGRFGGRVELRAILTAGRDLLLGETCAGGCGRPRSPLCPACERSLAPSPRAVVPLTPVAGFPVTRAAARYEGPVRAAVLAHKEHARRALDRPLGVLLASAVEAVTAAVGVPVAECVLVPVPSLRSAVRARGHDSVLDIARSASHRLDGTPPVHRMLRHTRRVRDQSGLDVAERRANLDAALAVRGDVRAGATVVVVDDLCSSGATLASAARAVQTATGRAQVLAAVVATPSLRGGDGR